MSSPEFIPLKDYVEYTPEEMVKRSEDFYSFIKTRRTVRDFSDRLVNEKVIKNCIRSAGTAPSGANLQPWNFVVVKDPEIK